jgi:hypothetical protein
MPWKGCSVMEERMRFVVRLLAGEQMSVVCREFGISRKTGYKIFERYKDYGLEALAGRSRRPFRYGNGCRFRWRQRSSSSRRRSLTGAPASIGNCC